MTATELAHPLCRAAFGREQWRVFLIIGHPDFEKSGPRGESSSEVISRLCVFVLVCCYVVLLLV